MARECHVRFWERAGVRFPRATRQVVISISGRKHRLWRAVDQHGVVLDILVQSRRNTKAAKWLLRNLLKIPRYAGDAQANMSHGERCEKALKDDWSAGAIGT